MFSRDTARRSPRTNEETRLLQWFDPEEDGESRITVDPLCRGALNFVVVAVAAAEQFIQQSAKSFRR
jgi:hypothetical protein